MQICKRSSNIKTFGTQGKLENDDGLPISNNVRQFQLKMAASDGGHRPLATCEEFSNKFGGKRVIKSILIANNGIAAVKCIRSIRRWAYETFSNDEAIKV